MLFYFISSVLEYIEVLLHVYIYIMCEYILSVTECMHECMSMCERASECLPS